MTDLETEAILTRLVERLSKLGGSLGMARAMAIIRAEPCLPVYQHAKLAGVSHATVRAARAALTKEGFTFIDTRLKSRKHA